MLNAEKYRDEIQKILDRGYRVALNKKTKKVVACEETSCNDCAFWTLKSGCCEIEKWLISVCEESILDEVEKEYLRGVIRPFRNEVKSIRKKIQTGEIYEFILIELSFDILVLPRFEKGTMYKGMVTNKEYTLEELGL